MPWGDDAIRFLSRVLPWPASNTDAGYGNIHYTVPNDKPLHANSPKQFWASGKACKSPAEAWSYVTYIYTQSYVRDIYFCTSLQAATTRNKKGKEVAWRDKTNTLGSKVTFLDIDVKPPPKGYATREEALKALAAMLKQWGLPFPSAIVGSGGGLHCYWISNRMLTPAEWQTYADPLRAAAVQAGLLCDGGVTIDIARVLRVPETRNWKTDPPLPTKLLHLADTDYDFATQLAPQLANVPKLLVAPAPVTTNTRAPTPPSEPVFDPKLFPKRLMPAAHVGIESGAAGLEPEAPVLDTHQVIKGCKFLYEALRTGGIHHDNPQWHLAIMATTFLPNGRMLAHKISNKHAQYDEANVDREYDRCVSDRTKGNMGYPSCASIEQNGSKECAGCPLRGKVRSPLNLGKVTPSPAQQAAGVTGAVTFSTAPEILPGYARFDAVLPDGYAFDADNNVCLILSLKEKDAAGEAAMRDVLVPMLYQQKMLNPYLQEAPHALHFEVDGNMGDIRKVFIERETFASPTDTLKRLHAQGVAPHPQTKNQLGDFLMTLSRRMELARKSINAKPLGWIADLEAGTYTAFAYGGQAFKTDGTSEPAGFLDEQMRAQYEPVGKIDPWIEAAAFVIAQKRPGYDVFLASAFAAPLMQFTGQNLGVVNLYGDSGIGKSTVLKIAQAVWGNPETARIHKDGTANGVPHKMGVLASLPVYWDEVTRDGNAQKSELSVLMMDGQERLRLIAKSGSGLSIRHSGTWCTVLASTSNPSFLDYITEKQRDTAAGRYRVFEFKESKRDTVTTEHWDVDGMIQKLRFNYGRVGEKYAAFLASKAGELPELVKARGREFDKLVGAKQEERFWSYYCACTLVGAEFARDLGFVEFDVPAMQAFLVETFKLLRAKLKHEGQEGVDVAMELLTAFIKEHYQNILITDNAPSGPGRGQIVNVIKGPRPEFAKGIYVQWVQRKTDPVLRISRLRLQDWMAEQDRDASVIFDRVTHTVTNRVRLGAGTQYVAGAERVVEIAVTPGSWMEDVMLSVGGFDPDRGEKVASASNEQNIIKDAAVAKLKDIAS